MSKIRSARGARKDATRAWRTRASSKDPYEMLGVSKDASLKDIKRAFRQKALRYHPDVSKDPNAQERFMEYKKAYQILSNSKQKTKFDEGSKRSWSNSGWKDANVGWNSRKGNVQEDVFYGFGDLFADIEKEMASYVEERKKKRGKEAPGTLWEEMAELGEEFVEFLEGAAGVVDQTSKDDGGDAWDRYAKRYQQNNQYDAGGTNEGSESFSGEKAKNEETESVEEMLEKLKREMGI